MDPAIIQFGDRGRLKGSLIATSVYPEERRDWTSTANLRSAMGEQRVRLSWPTSSRCQDLGAIVLPFRLLARSRLILRRRPRPPPRRHVPPLIAPVPGTAQRLHLHPASVNWT